MAEELKFSVKPVPLIEESREVGGPEPQDVQSREAKKKSRLLKVGHRKDFAYLEHVCGRPVNILEGMELHTNVFNRKEQKRIVDFVYDLQRQGQNQELEGRTYSEPRKWMRGKGRVTIQFGCCYNYAEDKEGNPPGIVPQEQVCQLPSLFQSIIKRLVRWEILPSSCVPDSCIVNIYEVGDCIPPHIDSHDFLRPFCTVSFLSECHIVFGSKIEIVGPGEFQGSCQLLLPLGSVLVFNGNAADVAKHAVPSVPSKSCALGAGYLSHFGEWMFQSGLACIHLDLYYDLENVLFPRGLAHFCLV